MSIEHRLDRIEESLRQLHHKFDQVIDLSKDASVLSERLRSPTDKLAADVASQQHQQSPEETQP